MKLLAVLAEAETTQACFNAAVAAATLIGPGTRIEALHVVVDPKTLVTSDEEVDLQMLRERHEGSAMDRADAVRRQFVSCVAGLGEDGPTITWRSVAGAEEPEVVRAAHDADIVLIAEPHNMDGHDALHAALFETGRPCLLVPNQVRDVHNFVGRAILYWGGGDSATPALEAALPWLRASSDVTILLVDQAYDRAAWVTKWLADHNVTSNVKVADRHQGSLSECVFKAARNLGAGLLVVGPRTHGRLIDWLIGGATHEFVANADLPTLLSH